MQGPCKTAEENERKLHHGNAQDLNNSGINLTASNNALLRTSTEHWYHRHHRYLNQLNGTGQNRTYINTC